MPPARPKVLLLSLNYSPESTGVAPYSSSLAKMLVERGCSVRAVVAHPHYPEWHVRDGYGQWRARALEDGVEVVRLRHYVPTPPTTTLTRLISEVTFGLRSASIRWGNPDVVIMVSPALISSAMAMTRVSLGRRRPRTVVWVQDIYSAALEETGGRTMTAPLQRLESALLRRADCVVAIHERFKQTMTHVLGQEPEHVEVIRNWTHLQPVRAACSVARVRETHGWAEHETVLLHAGNQGAKQALYQLIDAARSAHERGLPLRLVLLGNGNQHDRLRVAAHDLPNVQFIQPLPDDEYQAAMHAADLLVVSEGPGVRNMSVPSKLTSYFNAARPVLAVTPEGSITEAEIELAMAGTVVRPGDVEGIVAAALELSQDQDTARKYAENGRRFAQNNLTEDVAQYAFLQALGLAETGADDNTGQPDRGDWAAGPGGSAVRLAPPQSATRRLT